ncbi:MAG: ATP-dependent helicase, partial [Trichodesmium sp.]
VLRRGSDKNKLAILYEVVTENTTEEQTSRRRRGGIRRQKSPKSEEKKQEKSKVQPLEIVKPEPNYGINNPAAKLAAEPGAKYGNEKQNETKKTAKSQEKEQKKTEFQQLENIQPEQIYEINNPVVKRAAESRIKYGDEKQNNENNPEHGSGIKKDEKISENSDDNIDLEDFF